MVEAAHEELCTILHVRDGRFGELSDFDAEKLKELV